MPLRLALLDLDGTLKPDRDPYVYLHRQLGTLERSREFFELGMTGQISYAEWLRRDVALWAGQPLPRIQGVYRSSPYAIGAPQLLRALKRAGVVVALISTGLNLHAELIQEEFGLDHVFANLAIVADGVLTGHSEERVPEGGKGTIADRLLAELELTSGDVLAMGDGPSDIALFERAGVSVAVQPSSDAVRDAASIVLEEPDLRPLMPHLMKWLPEVHWRDLDV